MKLELRPLVLLPIILILLACRAPIPSLIPKPTLAPVIKDFPGKATSTPLPTNTPVPYVTLTPTAIPPSLTPTQVSISSPNPTLIPVNTQLSIFGNLWTIVDDTYVYPDFNGLDWNAIHQEYMQKISAGLTNEQFYQAMSELITRLGDDHSYFLDPQQVADQEAEYQGKHDPVVYQIITTPDGTRIGYILLITFEDSTVDEQVAAALQEMTAEAPLDGLILDNRMNGGGSSTVFEPMLSYFAGGDLGEYLNHDEQHPLQVKLNDINDSSQVPLVVLVGSETASFGEIFSGILQDLGRAYLIGTITEGNVEILWGYDLADGSQLWLANETFRPLNHPNQDWEKTGIIPDLTVSGEYDQYTLDNDPAVLAALQYFSGQ